MENIKMKDFKDISIVNELPFEDIQMIKEQVLRIKKGRHSEFQKLGEGFFGVVYQYKNYTIKVFKYVDHLNDFFILERLQGHKGYTKLYFYCKYFMVTQLIEGKTLADIKDLDLSNSWRDDLYEILMSSLNVGLVTDDVKSENIMIEDNTNNIYIVDVGSYVEKDKIAYPEKYILSWFSSLCKNIEMKCKVLY